TATAVSVTAIGITEILRPSRQRRAGIVSGSSSNRPIHPLRPRHTHTGGRSMSECVCDLYGGCCDDAREREHRRTFGVSENATKGSPAKAGGTGIRDRAAVSARRGQLEGTPPVFEIGEIE